MTFHYKVCCSGEWKSGGKLTFCCRLVTEQRCSLVELARVRAGSDLVHWLIRGSSDSNDCVGPLGHVFLCVVCGGMECRSKNHLIIFNQAICGSLK